MLFLQDDTNNYNIFIVIINLKKNNFLILFITNNIYTIILLVLKP